MRKLLGWVLVVLLAFVALMLFASEQGGEVVVLRTQDASGADHETRLWLVELGGELWLRSGDPSSGWFGRLEQAPEIELQREGEWARYRAVPVPEMAPRVDAAMAEKYGWADRLIAIFRPEGQSVAIRLDPASGSG